MQICRSIAQMRKTAVELRERGTIGFVPTMGALHDGHLSLVQHAVQAHENAVVSIFVNPTQFGDPNDLTNYPRTEESDLKMLTDAGVAAVFMPQISDMYHDDDETIVETTKLANIFHGLVRPDHFRGVTTIVNKMFNIIGADKAYFGKKDYQQLAVIKKMVRDLYMPIEIVGVETVREDDGLAMSSRNRRLTPEQRQAAPILNQALCDAAEFMKNGGDVDGAKALIDRMIGAEALADLQAIDVVKSNSFEPATGHPNELICIMISAQFGDILLIDQKEVRL